MANDTASQLLTGFSMYLLPLRSKRTCDQCQGFFKESMLGERAEFAAPKCWTLPAAICIRESLG